MATACESDGSDTASSHNTPEYPGAQVQTISFEVALTEHFAPFLQGL
jgi:hypothetical protein